MLWPRSRNSSLAAWAAWSALSAAYAQTPAARPAIRGGQADIAFQGYYLGGNQQDLLNITGVAIHFTEFLPQTGLLSGSFEGYGSQNRFQGGENYLELRGLPWAGRYWTFTGGDFRAPARLVDSPFNNIFVPPIEARGARVQATHGSTEYTLLWGQETLTAGARLAFRMPGPQNIMAATATRKFGRLVAGVRLMQFSASPQSIAENAYLFPAGRNAGLVRTAVAQALYMPFQRLKIYGEASRPLAGGPGFMSTVTGVSWESVVFTLKANYVRQGLLYYPLAGYFAGDRAGPYAEARLRPWKRFELYASANRYRNNLERDVRLGSLATSGVSAGVSALLPGKVSASGQLSEIRLTSEAPGEAALASHNRQISASLSRPIGRQTVQVSWRDLRLDMQPNPQRQKATEIGDNLQFRHFSVGGAVRYQQVTGAEQRNSLFFRGLAQVNAGPLSAYVNVEAGNDLANQTVFSTEAYRTSSAGLSLRLPGKWNLQTDVFRNSLNFALNPENVFLFQNGPLDGISPAAASLTPFSQWNLFFRLSRQIQWGGGLPSESAAAGPVVGMASLTGTVEGAVRLRTLAGAAPAAAIPMSLDGARTVVTTPDGRYLFDNVPEGFHQIGLALDELAADLDPGEVKASRIAVRPRRATSADFEVFPLSSISGRVSGPDKAELDGIVVRLLPGAKYTTTLKDGFFTLYNVREGDYALTVDPTSLPPNSELNPPEIAVSVRMGAPVAPVEFSFIVKTTQKPIRKVLERNQ